MAMPADLYAVLMFRKFDSHRFFILHSLSALSLRTTGEERTMLDLIMLAVGVGFFALAIAYSYACDRL